jgi:hypothetical protein
MKGALAIILILYLGIDLYGQTADKSPTADTIKALSNLRHRINKKARIYLIVGSAGVAATLLSVSLDKSNQGSGVYEFTGGVFAGIAAVGLFHITKENSRIRRAKTNFNNGIPIPKTLKDQLTVEDFISH